MFDFKKKLRKKCEGKEIKINKLEKRKNKEKEKINLKLINYFYMLFQIHSTYFNSFI